MGAGRPVPPPPPDPLPRGEGERSGPVSPPPLAGGGQGEGDSPEAPDGGYTLSERRQSRNPHIGSAFDDFLHEEGTAAEFTGQAVREIIGQPVKDHMTKAKV